MKNQLEQLLHATYSRTRGRFPGFPGWLALMLITLGLAATSCSSDKGKLRENIRPHVRLTGGPIQGDSASYTSEFFWSGWDDDGVIDHYQFAVDIPDNFTLDDINNPHDVGIAWQDTAAFRARFLFTTPVQDTILNRDGSTTLPNRYRGNHTFYVRSVDNEGGVSNADFLTFTARTVTPLTTITVPKVVSGGRDYLTVGRQFNVAWSGEDPDSPDPKRKPKYYEWKLIKVARVIGVTDANFVVNEDPGPNFPWNRVGADTLGVRVNLEPGSYVFAVRAIDEAGGTESKFFFGRNAVLMQSSSGPFVGKPVLTVRERTLGQNVFPADGQVVDYELPAGKCLRFEFSADAQDYGGVIQAYNWGVDVADDDAEGPNSGWRGWSLINYTYEPICFAQPGVHVVAIKVRDTGGGVTYGHIRITVISFPLDRDALYVDDYFKPVDPAVSGLTDAFIDTKLKNSLRAAGYDQVYELSPWGFGDLEGAVNNPKLSELARYKFIYWNVLGAGGGSQNANTALLQSAACATNRILSAYVSSGGSVMIFGELVFGALKDRSGNTGTCLGTTAYTPDQGLQFGARDFVCDYLHICGGDIRDAKTGNGNFLTRANPTAVARRFKMPTVEVDSTLFALSLTGVNLTDAMFQPTFFLEGGLDTLYTYEPTRSNSAFNGKPLAWRYADPKPIPEQGPVAIFGFPLHRMKEGRPWAGPDTSSAPGTHMQGMVSSMVWWFKQHQYRAQQYLSVK